jgi:c(7)-type cytochrome triheme protein
LYSGAGLLVLLLLILFGCGDSQLVRFDDFLARTKKTSQAGNPVFKKRYTTASMSRTEFTRLLDMTMYQGTPELYGDLIFHERSVKHNMDPVVFSHRIHRVQFTCRVCHLELEFSMKKGESGITREDYLDGRFCGACHNGEIAFHVNYACNLCHIPIDEQGQYQSKNIAVNGGSEQQYGDGVNWVEAMQSGVITPRNSLYSQENSAPVMPLPEYLKQPLRWTTREPRVHVRFSHEKHVQWLDCANCHPDLFTVEQMGTVAFDKEKILYGLYCGVCHMTVAFPINGCNRCHPSLKDRP